MNILLGEVVERFKALVLKTSEGVTLPWVRIPPSPSFYINYSRQDVAFFLFIQMPPALHLNKIGRLYECYKG